MQTNKKFSFSRFVKVMKYDLGSNWKSYLYSFLTISGIFLFCYLLAFVFLGSKGSQDTEASDAYSILLFVSGSMGVVIPFLFYIGAGRILKMMRTKEGRESYLMLPATRLEKFVSRAILSTLGVYILVVLGIIVSDLLRFVFHPLFSLPESMLQLQFPTLISEVFLSPFSIFETDYSEEPAMVAGLSWIVISLGFWTHSMFILGGTVFVKHPVIKTFGCLFLMFLVFSNLVIHINFENIASLTFEDGLTMMRILTVFIFVLYAFNWWLSYHLFSRAQIIRKKVF